MRRELYTRFPRPCQRAVGNAVPLTRASLKFDGTGAKQNQRLQPCAQNFVRLGSAFEGSFHPAMLPQTHPNFSHQESALLARFFERSPHELTRLVTFPRMVF